MPPQVSVRGWVPFAMPISRVASSRGMHNAGDPVMLADVAARLAALRGAFPQTTKPGAVVACSGILAGCDGTH